MLMRKKIIKEKMAAGIVDGKFGHHNDAKDAREKKVECIPSYFLTKNTNLYYSNAVFDAFCVLPRRSCWLGKRYSNGWTTK